MGPLSQTTCRPVADQQGRPFQERPHFSPQSQRILKRLGCRQPHVATPATLNQYVTVDCKSRPHLGISSEPDDKHGPATGIAHQIGPGSSPSGVADSQPRGVSGRRMVTLDWQSKISCEPPLSIPPCSEPSVVHGVL